MGTDQQRFGINVYGHISGNFGLAVAARNTLRTLVDAGVDVCTVDIDAGPGRSGSDRSFDSLTCTSTAGMFPVSLFHTNPTDIYSYAVETPARTWAPDRLRLLVPFWELPGIPPGVWREFISAMDLVLAPTKFIAEAVRSSCPETPVIHYPQAVFLPEGIAPDRERFGLEPSAFVCLSVLDAKSGLERKNPMASVAAFREAFAALGRRDVQLVIKMTGRAGAQRYSAHLDQLLAEADGDDRIIVIEESMEYADVLSLNASADVLISLHRAEGLGLNLMEAMSLGTVVLGTGWSGNMDFMTPENSVVVGCSPTPVESVHPSYAADVIGPGQYWMEPDVHEAAAGLRRLYDDRVLLGSLAERARADMEDARNSFRRGAWIDSVRALVDDGALESPVHQSRSRAFVEVMRVPVARRARRWAGNQARRFGLLQ